MTENEFYRKFHGVATPKYRGAPAPKFDEFAINEPKFADELRFKDYKIDFIEGVDGSSDKINIDWTSYEWAGSEGVDSLVAEITRCFKKIGFNGNVVLNIWKRDEQDNPEYEDYREFKIVKS